MDDTNDAKNPLHKNPKNEGIEEDDEMLPSCVEDVRASIDVDGDGDIRCPLPPFYMPRSKHIGVPI